MTAHNTQRPSTNHVVYPVAHFIDRQQEFALLWNQYRMAQDGSARLALLVGELGIGKTRLLNELAARARQDGVIVLQGAASDAEEMPPYLPFLESLSQYIQATPTDVLREQTVLTAPILVSIFPELALRLGDLPAPYAFPPEQMRLRLYEAIGAWLETISLSQTLVLTLDDLHWADSATFDLLGHVLLHQTRAKLLIVGAYRETEVDQDTALERTVAKLARQRILIKLSLQPLPSRAIGELAASYLGASVAQAVGELLYQQSEGNPFFAEELLQDWIEAGKLVQENRQWVVTEPLKNSLPEGIFGTLRQRFARLPGLVIDDLRCAAVIGRTFDLTLLAGIREQEAEVVEERLLLAERAGLVRTDQKGIFTFSHEKIREALYAEISSSRRKHLHGAIGRALEARYDLKSGKKVDHLAELTFHFTRSGDRTRCAIYSQLAAEEALQSSAIEEAIKHYRVAIEWLEPDDENFGKLSSCLANEENAQKVVECYLSLARMYYWMADIRYATKICTYVLTLVEESGHVYLAGKACSWLALLFASQGMWVEAQHMFERIQPGVNHLANDVLKQPEEQHPQLAFLHQVKGFLAYQQEDYIEAEQELGQVIEKWQGGSMGSLFYAGLSGVVQAESGKYEEAAAYLVRLEGLLSELRSSSIFTAPILVCMASIALNVDDQGKANDLYLKLKAFRGQHYWFLVDRILGMIAARKGDHEAATEYLMAAEATARRESLRPELARTLLELANLETIYVGNMTKAENYLQQAQMLYEELNMKQASIRMRNRQPVPIHKSKGSMRQPLPANLTRREAEVLRLVATGKSNRQIAHELKLSESTVANHLAHIFSKTGSENRAAATAFAIRHKLI